MKQRKTHIHIYTGNGKGKTSAALGLAMRAIGWGMKVCVFQFLKKGVNGEAKIADTLEGRLKVSDPDIFCRRLKIRSFQQRGQGHCTRQRAITMTG